MDIFLKKSLLLIQRSLDNIRHYDFEYLKKLLHPLELAIKRFCILRGFFCLLTNLKQYRRWQQEQQGKLFI